MVLPFAHDDVLFENFDSCSQFNISLEDPEEEPEEFEYESEEDEESIEEPEEDEASKSQIFDLLRKSTKENIVKILKHIYKGSDNFLDEYYRFVTMLK